MKTNIWKTRGSEEFPRTYVPKDIDLGNWDELDPLLEGLFERGLSTAKEVESWLSDRGELLACVGEEGSRRYIAMTCHTDDSKLEQAYLHFVTEIVPQLKPWDDRLNRKYLDSTGREGLDTERFSVFDRALDPEHKTDLAPGDPAAREALLREIEHQLDLAGEGSVAARAKRLEEELRALGYLVEPPAELPPELRPDAAATP